MVCVLQPSKNRYICDRRLPDQLLPLSLCHWLKFTGILKISAGDYFS
jgi:hypothetical protein